MSSRRPANRTKLKSKKNMSRQYTSSFSGIDWGGMLSGSFRSRQSDFSVGLGEVDLDLPSLAGSVEGNKKKKKGGGVQEGGDEQVAANNFVDDEAAGSKYLVQQVLQEDVNSSVRSSNSTSLWKEVTEMYSYAPTKRSKKHSMHEDIMEDGQYVKQAIAKNGEEEEEDGERRIPWCRVITLLTIVVAAVVCFSTLISKKAVINTNTKAMRSNMLGVVIDDTVQQQLLLQQQQTRGQELLELAEQITMACGESSLLHSSSSVSSVNIATGMATCQTLCKDHMCCVEEDEEYSCKSDVEQDCGAYAGCVALIDDNFR